MYLEVQMMSRLSFVTDSQTKDSLSPRIHNINKTDKALGKKSIIISILQSENCIQLSLGPAEGLFSYSAGYIVCRLTRVIILFPPCKVKHMSLQKWPGQDHMWSLWQRQEINQQLMNFNFLLLKVYPPS